MPKNEIDYSNTIIYKITCKDSMVSDLYVGHTTNFVQRKHAHKQSCINTKSPNHKCKLYEVIRNNGGWVNWKMEIINFFNCINHYEARKKEQEYFVALNATLNSIEPYAIPKPKEVIVKNTIIKEVLHCNECNKYFSNKNLLETHNKSNKHIKNLEKSPKIAKKFNCEICNYNCSKESDYKKHLQTRKHTKLISVNLQLIQKSQIFICAVCHKEYKSNVGLWKHKKKCKNITPNHITPNKDDNHTTTTTTKFICQCCDYKCNKESDYNKHLTTTKHKNNYTQLHINGDKSPKKYSCICGKEYNFRQGLYTHKKKCKNNTIIDNENTIINPANDIKALTNLVLELVKSNHDLQHQMIEVCKNSNNSNNSITHNNNNNSSINNSHNKTFNLQVFLNEDCKDAMNLSEFVNSLQLQLSDLDNMGKLGYTEGISKIIMTEMNDLEQTKRPVHCSDIKRETLYVKDEDKWEKEQPDHPKLNKAIRKIEQKNFGLMGEWQAEHPTYMESTSEENNEFLKLISQTVNGTPENINKVIKKIAKEVVIDKLIL